MFRPFSSHTYQVPKNHTYRPSSKGIISQSSSSSNSSNAPVNLRFGGLILSSPSLSRISIQGPKSVSLRYTPIGGDGLGPYRGPMISVEFRPLLPLPGVSLSGSSLAEGSRGGKKCTDRSRAERGRKMVSLGVVMRAGVQSKGCADFDFACFSVESP